MFDVLTSNVFHPSFGILYFRSQEQQQQQCGITSVRLMGGTSTAIPRQRPAAVNVGMTTNNSNIVGNILPQHVPISYYTHSSPQTSYFNDVLKPMQVKCLKSLSNKNIFV